MAHPVWKAALIATAAAFVTPVAVHAAHTIEAPQASIPFANHGGIQDWRADGDHAIYIEDQHNHWFRAELMGSAFDLPFAEGVGFEPGPTGDLDSFGAVVVRGQRYPFTSLVAVSGPPASAKGGVKNHGASAKPAPKS